MFIFNKNACLSVNGMKNFPVLKENIQCFLFLIKIMNSGMVPCQQVAGKFRIACVNGGQDSGIPWPAAFFLFFS